MGGKTTIVLELTDAEAQELMSVLIECPYWEDFKHCESIYNAIEDVTPHKHFADTTMEYDPKLRHCRKVKP